MLTQQRGMTPTELVVVIVLVAILAVVAVPSYLSSVQKSRRTDAKTALKTSAQAMERVFTQTSTYADVTVGTNGVYSVSDHGHYTIAFRDGGATNTNATAYQLIATPVGSQANDPCGVLKLDQADDRTAA